MASRICRAFMGICYVKWWIEGEAGAVCVKLVGLGSGRTSYSGAVIWRTAGTSVLQCHMYRVFSTYWASSDF
jgi:hypothetical protein